MNGLAGDKKSAATVEITVSGKQALERIVGKYLVRKEFLGRLVEWFERLDKSEQAIIMSQVQDEDEASIAQLVIDRQRRRASASVGEALQDDSKLRPVRDRKSSGRLA